MEHWLALERIMVHNATVESIFCLNDVIEQQVNLGLQRILLHDLPMMTHHFVGPENSFSLQNVTMIRIVRCEKLQVIFCAATLRCLPQLLDLIIEECDELKHIIEDDLEDKISQSSKTFFPKLERLIVRKCDKLKYVFPVSICKEFPELKVMFIREANVLEDIFKSE